MRGGEKEIHDGIMTAREINYLPSSLENLPTVAVPMRTTGRNPGCYECRRNMKKVRIYQELLSDGCIEVSIQVVNYGWMYGWMDGRTFV